MALNQFPGRVDCAADVSLRRWTRPGLTWPNVQVTAPLIVERLDVAEQLYLDLAAGLKMFPELSMTVENQLSMTELS